MEETYPSHVGAVAENQTQERPQYLYHYTTQAGLIGIAQSKQLWTTHIQYLNDSIEFKTAIRVVQEILSEYFDGPLWPLIEDPAYTAEQCAIKTIDKFRPKSENQGVFVACFCQQGDLFSQGKSYTSASSGYSLGFCTEVLHRLAKSENYTLGRCIYSHQDQRSIVEEYVTQILTKMLRAKADDQQRLSLEFWSMVQDIGAFFKEPSLEDEQEWRLVSRPIDMTSRAIRFRQGKSMLVPFSLFDLPNLLGEVIAHAYVGPCPHMEIAKQSASWLLQVEMKETNMPFRIVIPKPA
jgi:hypothetical protein